MARQLVDAQVWAFEGTDEETVLEEIRVWVGQRKKASPDRPLTIFGITFERIEEGEGPIDGAKVVANVAFE